LGCWPWFAQGAGWRCPGSPKSAVAARRVGEQQLILKRQEFLRSAPAAWTGLIQTFGLGAGRWDRGHRHAGHQAIRSPPTIHPPADGPRANVRVVVTIRGRTVRDRGVQQLVSTVFHAGKRFCQMRSRYERLSRFRPKAAGLISPRSDDPHHATSWRIRLGVITLAPIVIGEIQCQRRGRFAASGAKAHPVAPRPTACDESRAGPPCSAAQTPARIPQAVRAARRPGAEPRHDQLRAQPPGKGTRPEHCRWGAHNLSIPLSKRDRGTRYSPFIAVLCSLARHRTISTVGGPRDQTPGPRSMRIPAKGFQIGQAQTTTTPRPVAVSRRVLSVRPKSRIATRPSSPPGATQGPARSPCTYRR